MSKKQLRSILIWFSIFEILLAITLITREIFHYFRLPSMSDPIYELVDLFKYKESVYSPLFMWLIILFSGIKLLQFKKSGWILNASLFSMLYFVALYPLVHHLFPFDITLVILTVLLTVVYVVILKILYKRQLQELFKFKKIDKVYGVLIGIGLAAIYWIIKFYLEK